MTGRFARRINSCKMRLGILYQCKADVTPGIERIDKYIPEWVRYIIGHILLDIYYW